MTWQQEAVKAWRAWRTKDNEPKVIPAYEQVGKILEFCRLDETKVIEFIDSQIEADKGTAMFKSSYVDNYWPEVKRKFYEIQVNNMIMAD